MKEYEIVVTMTSTYKEVGTFASDDEAKAFADFLSGDLLPDEMDLQSITYAVDGVECQ